MMNEWIWGEPLPWAWVSIIVYWTLLLLGTDYVWRTSKWGGKTIFLIAAALGLLGTALIFFL